MNEIYIFFAEGFEEIEALTPCDVLRRAGFKVNLTSTTDSLYVAGARNITVKCDIFIQEVNIDNALMLILPGGMPGASNLNNNSKVIDMIQNFADSGKWIAAICAAPMILGGMELLSGKKATCYPGYEKYLKGATFIKEPVVTDGKIITSCSAGTAMVFSFEILKQLAGSKVAEELGEKMGVKYKL